MLVANGCIPAAVADQWKGAPAGWRPPRRCRCRLAMRASLLGLLRGSNSSASDLTTDPEGEALKQWLVERGLPPQKLASAKIPGSGRGLVAAQPIGKGESLLSIPRQLMLTPAAAQQQARLRPLLDATPLPTWSVLALWLAEQRAAGTGGEWWPYVRLLPETTGCVLEWTEEEVGWLCGSQLHADALEIRAAAEASWAEMQPLLVVAEAQGLAPMPGTFSRAALQWAFAMLLSRLVRLAGLGEIEVLVPWADLLNHDCGAANFLDWSAAEETVVLRAERRYRAGEQMLISYGQKTSGELLLSYGFCPEPGSNPHDGCRLRLELEAADAESTAPEWKAAALRQHGFSANQLFPLRMEAAPYELVHYAAFSAAEVGSQAEAEQLARRLFAGADFPPTLQRAALEAVIAACKAALAAYPRTFDTDRAELDALQDQAAAAAAAGAGGRADAGSDTQGLQRRQHVLQTLVYERQVLNRTVFVLQQELKDVQRLAGQGS